MTTPDPLILFRSLISLCGLSQAEVGEVLGRDHNTIRQKASGHRPVVERDIEVLADLWRKIDAGDEGLEGRPADQAATIAWVRSRTPTD